MSRFFIILSSMLFIGFMTLPTKLYNEAIAGNLIHLNAHIINEKSENVKVYYFHATRRCATCQAVEAVTKDALKEYYGDKVTFESINMDNEKDILLVEKFKISGTALILVNGDKIVNLTNDAFLNARSNPDKFKKKLKSTIDSMM